MKINREGWLTTKEVIEYIKTKHNRHWTRLYVYVLLSRKCLHRDKLGHINLYNVKEVDRYINLLKRPSSTGVKGKGYKCEHTRPLVVAKG